MLKQVKNILKKQKKKKRNLITSAKRSVCVIGSSVSLRCP